MEVQDTYNNNQILKITLNQNKSHLCITKSNGYTIINADNFTEAPERRLDFNITKAYLVYTKSLVVLLSQTTDNNESTEIILWDDKKTKEMVRLNYSSPI